MELNKDSYYFIAGLGKFNRFEKSQYSSMYLVRASMQT